MQVRVDDRRPFLVALAALIVLAWLALWSWDRSPYARFLHHEGLSHVIAGDRALFLVFVAGWTVMTVAMMLPSSLPLVTLFHGMTRQRAGGGWLLGLLLAGYLAVWTAFGVVVHLGDLGLHEIVHRSQWLAEHAWVLGTAALLVAGVYQFTPLKYHCLDKCRTPLGFIVGHWRGRRPRREALEMGIRHGFYCVGCCWSLMLLMFVVGVGSLGWMLALGAVMAAEKNLPWGRRLSAPLGGALLVAAWLVVAHQLLFGVTI